MKNLRIQNSALAALTSLSLILPAQAVDSSAGSGEIAIYTQPAAGTSDLTTANFTHDFAATNIREDTGSFSRSGSNIALNRTGFYLAIYNSQFNSTGGGNRTEIQSNLKLNGADLPAGWSQGYIRRGNGQDEAVTAGFAVFSATATDVLTLNSFRTDNNAAGLARRAANATGLQLVKLDDVNMAYAELSLAANSPGPTTGTFVTVPYAVPATTPDAGSFVYDGSGGLTLVKGGKYLVTANTYVNGPVDRTALVQRLTTNGSPVTGSLTTAFIRGSSQNSCTDGSTSLGMIIDAAAGEVLRVQASLDDNDASTFIGGRCALSVVELPATAGIPAVAPDYIRLTDGTGQNSIPAADTALTFATQVEPPSADFTHIASPAGSTVTAGTGGDYLFFGSIYDPSALSNAGNRAFFNQGWYMNGAPREQYGQCGRYIRGNPNPQVVQYGSASGLVAPMLAPNSTVEMVTRGLATTTNPEPADSLALQGVRLASLFTFDIFGVDSDLSAVAVDEATPTTSAAYNLNLRTATSGTVEVTATADGDTEVSTDDANFFNSVTLTFTAAGGTAPQTVFVRAVDDSDIEGTEMSIISHAITASDDPNYGLAKPIPNVEAVVTDNDVIPVDAVDDSYTGADEDTIASDATLTPADSLIANDLDGVNNTVTAFDPTSALGAAVLVNPDGTFTWDPTGTPSFNALAAGEQVVDSFSYTVTDGDGNSDSATVTITVDGANDAPVTNSEDSRLLAGSLSANLLSNDSDADASDVLTVSNFDAAGNGGAVPTTTFNGQPVPLVFTTAEGATVTVRADGSFVYDPSTSASILALADGATLSETFSYDVVDGTATTAASITITSVGSVGATDDISATAASATVNFDALANDSVYGGAAGAPTAGPELQFAQGTVGNVDTTWIQDGAASIASITLSNPGVESLLDLAITNAPAGFGSAYSLSGTDSGALHPTYRDVTMGQFETLDVSFELVFRPSDQVGREVLWEGGGNGNGTSIVLIDNLIVLSESDGLPELAQTVATLPAGAVAGGEFVHLVGQVDLTGNIVSLYVNGVLANTAGAIDQNTGAAADIVNLAGIDGGGLGVNQGTIAGENFAGTFGTINTGGYGPFSGELAVARVYESILTPTEILDNYKAVVGATVSTAMAGDVVELNGNAAPVAGTTVETLASGATVTFESDGSFTYDPNGAYDDLALGLTAIDSFTYKIGTHNNPTATARVVVTGTNPNPQITIVADQASFDEGTTGSFTVNASASVTAGATVTVAYSGAAQDPEDYLGSLTTVIIPPLGTSATVTLTALADSLFEGGPENIVATVVSVTGDVVLGATLEAETFINDLDPAPTVSIAANAPDYTEGESASFTVSLDVNSAVDVTADISFSGTATDGQDYFGLVTSVTVPGGSSSAGLDLFLFDDGITEGAEVLTVTIDSVSEGTIGTASADTNVNDGAGECLFAADFEGINPGDTTGGTLINSDAPEAANLGTAVGSWTGIFTTTAGGDAPGVIPEGNDSKLNGLDVALRLDRPGPGDGNVFAEFAAPLDISGANTGTITIDLGTRRTQGNSEAKSYRLIGLDASGQKSFELYVSANDTGPDNERLLHVDSVGTFTPLGSAFDFNNTGGYNESSLTNLRLVLTSAGYTVAIDKFPIDGVFESITSGLAYAGPATQISRLKIELSGSTDTTVNSGMFLDDVKVGGIRANVGPSLALDGAPLAEGGSTPLLFAVINSTKTLSSADNTEVQVADPDAASLTVRLEAVNMLGTLTVSLQGSATISAGVNGTFDLTVSGSVADVNDTLAAGIDYAVGALGGNEIIRLTADDGGSSGAGGALSSTHDLIFQIFEDPTVTIEQDPGQADPALVGPINFEVVFSEPVEGFGAEASDVDLSASTTAGTLSAVVTGGPSTYNVAVSGMTGSGNVIASIPPGAAQRPVTGENNVASASIDNVVEYIQNVSPVATNLLQSTHLAVINPGDMVPFDPILISDPNHVTTSTLNTGTTAFVDYPAVNTSTTFTSSDPTNTLGLSMEVCFTPEAADVAVGGAGTENRRIVFNIGGSSNGSGIYLIEGAPYFIAKMNSVAATFPASLNDTSWDSGSSDDVICVPLSAGALSPGVPAKIAMIFSLDNVHYSVNGAAPADAVLTDRGTRTNWAGDNSLRIGTLGGPGGLSSSVGNIFTEGDYQAMSGGDSAFAYARMFNVSDGTITIDTVDRPETITATVSIDGYVDDATSGSLSAASGNGESYSAGTWTITALRDTVNAALAEVVYTFGTAAPPATFTISIDDGDEDGGGALSGGAAISTIISGTVYVDDDFSGAAGSTIADADGGTPVSAATFLVDAFTNLTDALAAIDDTSTVVVNDGDYSGETGILTGTATLRLTDAGDSVAIGSLDAAGTNTINIQTSNLTLGDAIGSSIIDCPITGTTGTLTKTGTDDLRLRGASTFTGVTTINEGRIVITYQDATDRGSLASTGITVTAPGILAVGALVDTTYTHSNPISGTGTVSSFEDGTIVFNTPGGNSFSGGFDLGDGTTSNFDGTTGNRQGFVVVNDSNDLGTGKILSRGSQLQAGSPGIVIPNDIDITGGGFRNGGSIDFAFSGQINPIGGSDRGFGNYGLDGLTLTITAAGGVDNSNGRVIPEGINGADNGTWIFDCDITGSGGFVVQNSFDGGEVFLNGNNSYAGDTEVRTGTLYLNGAHAGSGAYRVIGEGILAGSGSTDGPVTIAATGTLSPGASIGTLGTGDLTVAGTLVVEVDNTTGAAGTAYDQVVVTGAVDVSGGTLEVIDLGTTVEEFPSEIAIIANDDTEAVVGTFGTVNGPAIDYLGSGAGVEVGYAGGSDSNDVVLNQAAALSIIGTWRAANFGGDTTNSGAGANTNDANGNGLVNLFDFLFGFNPVGPNSSGNTLEVSGGVITQHGRLTFVADASGDVFMRYTRRSDYVAAGLEITDFFSRDLLDFEAAVSAPAVIGSGTGDDGVAIEAVEIQLPLVLPVNGGKARFGRVGVDLP